MKEVKNVEVNDVVEEVVETKQGFFTKAKDWTKNHANAIKGVALGVGVGVIGLVGYALGRSACEDLDYCDSDESTESEDDFTEEETE